MDAHGFQMNGSMKCLLQVGSQVMLLRNIDLNGGAESMLVNGSRGVVTSFKAREVNSLRPVQQDTLHSMLIVDVL